MKPPAWSEGPSTDAEKARVVHAAIAEVIGDPPAADPLLLLIPDPPLPVDQAALAKRSATFAWGRRGWGLATRDVDLAQDLLWELFESRCDELTLIAISDAAELAIDASTLSRLAVALMTGPILADAAGGRPFVGLTYDWGEPICRFDTTGETRYV